MRAAREIKPEGKRLINKLTRERNHLLHEKRKREQSIHELARKIIGVDK